MKLIVYIWQNHENIWPMAQSLTQIYIHCVFHVKNSSIRIAEKDFSDLWNYMGGIVNKQGAVSLRIGGIGDHVHLLFVASKNISLADFVRNVKAASSKWMHQRTVAYRDFAWQNGYGAFSVSASVLEKTCAYIDRQKLHHARVDTREEYLSLLAAYSVEYDPAYLLTD